MAPDARPANVVVRDGARWKLLWRQLHAEETPRPALPHVNFAKYMLIAVRRGFSGSWGYDIEVKSILAERRRLLVTVESTAPGSNCVMPAVITAPYHVVRVRRSDKRVTFRQHGTVYDC